MAAKPKLALDQPTTIPLDKLILSDSNVRQIGTDDGIEALADDIARRGLLQSLSVRPVLDAEGNETGAYEVTAGGRRFRALKLLAKQKRLAKNAPEGTRGFLLNHLISDRTPRGDYANADPMTGRAAWFDLRVRIRKAAAQDAQAPQSQPQFPPLAFAAADNAPLRYGAELRAGDVRAARTQEHD